MGIRFIKIAVLYFAVGISMGLYMGITGQFTLAPVHAHLNLLGWASLALVGIVYQLFPAAGTTRLAQFHFWLHNLGLPPLMVALVLVLTGRPALEPLVGVFSLVVGTGILLFVINVWRTVQPSTVNVPVPGAATQAAMR
jgi:cbb3-type cytochrome oxidase subunit 1